MSRWCKAGLGPSRTDPCKAESYQARPGLCEAGAMRQALALCAGLVPAKKYCLYIHRIFNVYLEPMYSHSQIAEYETIYMELILNNFFKIMSATASSLNLYKQN